MPHSPCARGCCYTGLQVCARAYSCACHQEALTGWLHAPTTEAPVRLGHRDPTANQAIGNVMKGAKE